MPAPAPCRMRITEVRALPYAGFCCPGDRRYYGPLRLPPHCPGLRCGLIPGRASAAIDTTPGTGGPPQLTDQPSLHAVASTPERFRGAPETKPRTAAFTRSIQVRPAHSLRETFATRQRSRDVAACRFASPR